MIDQSGEHDERLGAEEGMDHTGHRIDRQILGHADAPLGIVLYNAS